MFTRKKPSRTVTKHTLTINEYKIPFTLISSNLAKRVNLKIGVNSGLEIVIPRRFNRDELPNIIKEKKEWILKNLKYAEIQKQKKPKFQTRSIITILGVPKVLHLLHSDKSRSYIKIDDENIYIYCNGMVSDAKETLEKYFKQVAKKYFKDRTAELSGLMGTKYKKITIRGQKSRWGSCSREGNLNFNWRLILTTPRIVDSIIIHELAHTIHLNHSREFYKFVEKFCPSHKKLSKILKETQFII